MRNWYSPQPSSCCCCCNKFSCKHGVVYCRCCSWLQSTVIIFSRKIGSLTALQGKLIGHDNIINTKRNHTQAIQIDVCWQILRSGMHVKLVDSSHVIAAVVAGKLLLDLRHETLLGWGTHAVSLVERSVITWSMVTRQLVLQLGHEAFLLSSPWLPRACTKRINSNHVRQHTVTMSQNGYYLDLHIIYFLFVEEAYIMLQGPPRNY